MSLYHLVLQNGNKIVSRHDTAQDAKQAAKELRDAHPKAAYWYAKVTKVYRAEEVPPSYTPIEEDV